MDKITSGNAVAQLPAKPKEPEIQFKKATIGGSRPVMRMNVSNAPKPAVPTKNLVASLDDLEDLE